MTVERTTVSEKIVPVDDIFDTVRRILAETLGVPQETITPDAVLFDDLGAESIDFIDIAIRIERTLGVKLPTREWGAFARRERGQLPMAELAQLLEAHHGIKRSPEEQEELGKFGLGPMCDRIQERYGVEIPHATRLEWARRGMERHSKVFESLFLQPLPAADFERLVELASEDVYSEKFTKALRRLFTVRVICQFLAASLSGQREEG
jgi:acyl carrier protein